MEFSTITGIRVIVENKTDMSTEKLDWLYHNIACRAAVKAGQITSDQELIALAVALRENPEIRYCPHGRPVSITLRQVQSHKISLPLLLGSVLYTVLSYSAKSAGHLFRQNSVFL